MATHITSRLRLGLLLLLLPLVTACGIQPWVKPYERQQLADPLMSFDRDPLASAYLHHVYQSREGARGAEGSGGGGCGCN
jgi:hypothetical protein